VELEEKHGKLNVSIMYL